MRAKKRNVEMFEAVLRGKTLKSTGVEFGVTPERVRQIINVLRRRMVSPTFLGTHILPDHDHYKLSEMRKHEYFWRCQLKRITLI